MRAFAIAIATVFSLLGAILAYYFAIPVAAPTVPPKILRIPDPFPRPHFSGPVDGYVRVKGKVLEWLDPPLGNNSVAYVDEEPTRPPSTTPLKNASITLLLSWPQQENTLWKTTTTSNDKGLFDLGSTTAPGFYNMALVITKKEFGSVRRIFYHGKINHDATILMIRSPSKTSSGRKSE